MKPVIAVLILSLAPLPALACDFCSGATVLNSARAACFQEIFDDRMQRLEQSNRGFVRIDLDSCSGVRAAPSKGVAPSLDSEDDTYAGGGALILDAPRMHCLARIVEESGGEFDPAKLVSISADCPA